MPTRQPPEPFSPAGLPAMATADFADGLLLDVARSQPFQPHFDFSRSHPADQLRAFYTQSVAAAVRASRQQRYADRLGDGWTGPCLLADGDSWLHFPMVRDLVAQLDGDHAINCLAGEGDPLRNPIRSRRIGEAIIERRPDAVLLSIGGGDILAGFRLPAFIERFARKRPAADYPSPYFVACLYRELLPRIVALLIGIRSLDARLPVVLHSYAYGRPRDFIWLGRPLRELGIEDPTMQREIVAALIDRFHTALVQGIAIAGLHNVHVVDCRDCVGANWFDELHPNNAGFEAIAGRFREVLARVA